MLDKKPDRRPTIPLIEETLADLRDGALASLGDTGPIGLRALEQESGKFRAMTPRPPREVTSDLEIPRRAPPRALVALAIALAMLGIGGALCEADAARDRAASGSGERPRPRPRRLRRRRRRRRRADGQPPAATTAAETPRATKAPARAPVVKVATRKKSAGHDEAAAPAEPPAKPNRDLHDRPHSPRRSRRLRRLRYALLVLVAALALLVAGRAREPAPHGAPAAEARRTKRASSTRRA